MDMARVGPGIAGGNNRQTLTDEDAEGRALFADWCDAAGLPMAVDQMGSMFAQRPGSDPEALPIAVGSHLDTQPTGGKYDGVLGVLAGLELIRTLNDLKIRTRRPIVLVNWTNEEGARFSPPMLASGVHAGVHSLDWGLARTDSDGRTFGDELARIGWAGKESVGSRKFHAYYELHIEQGPILEAEGAEIGVVTHGQGLRWIKMRVTGRESHTGSTPMPLRRNAGLGMARITQAVDEIAWAHAPHAVGAIGHCEIYPNSPNIIAGHCLFTIDIRHPDQTVLVEMEAAVRDRAAAICRELGLELEIEVAGQFDPVTFDAACIANIRNAADAFGYRHRDIVSGAGHDAFWISHVAPSGMIMCPCVGGLSHNEAEEITPEWARAGCDVLLHAVVEAAEIVA